MSDLPSFFAPTSEVEAAEFIVSARGQKQKLRLVGGDTRRLPDSYDAACVLSARALTGIVFYEPAELTLRVKSGTTLAEIEALLDANNQMLAFEPSDQRALLRHAGKTIAEPTIGGVVGANVSGPRRIQVGAARDHVLGVRFVNGRGEAIMGGGRVMKNVTGLDLPKLICGSYGALGFVTEVTVKVLPKPEAAMTLQWQGLSDEQGVALLCAALGTPFSVSGTAHLPAPELKDTRTLLRLEGTPAQLAYRREALTKKLAEFGAATCVEGEDSLALWQGVRDGLLLLTAEEAVLWRVSTTPTQAPVLVASLGQRVMAHYYDWSGGLVWLAMSPEDNGGAGQIRAALAKIGSHATLIRAPLNIARHVPIFEPQPAPLAKISAGIKHSLDPDGVFVSAMG